MHDWSTETARCSEQTEEIMTAPNFNLEAVKTLLSLDKGVGINRDIVKFTWIVKQAGGVKARAMLSKGIQGRYSVYWDIVQAG